MEIWKDIKDYEGYYMVSNLGRVKSLDRVATTKRGVVKNTKGKILNLTLKNNGYLSVMFSLKDKRKRFHVHRLVAYAFIENIHSKPFVNHINGIKTDNSVINLEWCTHKENAQHALKHNLTKKGEESTSSKLTENQVIAIRRLYRLNPKFNKLKLSKKLGVQDTTIHKIIKNQRWKHI